LAEFAFEFSTEFPASLANLAFRENFLPEVLIARVHLSLQRPVVVRDNEELACQIARVA
jgi:hypothetical protein